MDASRPCVVFFGAANLDSFYRVTALPMPGETVLGTGLVTAVGGKGANQAIAAARTGVDARFLGAVGRDADGARVVDSLTAAGVAVDGLIRLEHAPTGRAVILVDEQGQNVIVVTAAANNALTPGHVEVVADTIADAAVLVVQGEIPAAATSAAIDTADRSGVRVIVNLAPYIDLEEAIGSADPLVLNEIEATQLLGRAVTGPESIEVVADLTRHARSAVVTVGAAGALVVEQGAVTHVPAPVAARVVDTTGAGDAFVGVLAAALASGFGLHDGVVQAVHAATASVEALGAGESYPDFQLDGLSEAVAG
jgi:ribokinase